ncbi:signal-induced proliferation-associated 1-like protein 3 isoform X1 [Xenopus tropicalis]|uniref:Signal induced proliferation associated 1 like 3 n=1 Tax=Xenopus tropicalis TaxID=8364 RepID=A0A6I8SQ65_XENTR|nr:signal-induced proliferation-associated 1-like protein 3 isoform X1 [Xenopus tropicalis]XP_004917086.1 signal-induced proliferation-associated 1-like protein 3 isoform X1 [Xenopus tropicalis]XP_004917087.1 signal-induced proliferation-associated 1-like protein 3 isoform X1 [Xenopus tropicalis]XP_004917088.1 signal-induced proliferation-associated 1-like protein 3 isoform X1 [Xenopus tropicalis]|eukprot:XP_002940653.2 PREDICTED: signal-induced proliferation-associated 1-like protein 3 isoform X1 [Xenopus tropicalis]
MTSFRSYQNDGVEAGGVSMKGNDLRAVEYYPHGYWMQSSNGVQLPSSGDASRTNAITPAMPKMGVRARIADWPPKKEAVRETLTPSHSQDMEGLNEGFQNGQNFQSTRGSPAFRGIHRLSRKRSNDVEFQDGWPRSPGRLFLPLRNRSNSEITLSECDMDEAVESRGTKFTNGMPLFREYGSTSSINVQGISEQSFFDMLKDFKNEKPGQSGKSPDQGNSLLREDSSMASSLHLVGSSITDLRNGQFQKDDPGLKDKEKLRKKNTKGDSSDSSLFRKLRNNKNESEPGRSFNEQDESIKPWLCPKTFAHYDVQSMLFNLNEIAANRTYVAQRRNTTTGASAASAVSLAVSRAYGLGNIDPSFTSTEDLNFKENLEQDMGDNNSNELLLNCPHFRNETGGLSERNVSFSKASLGTPCGSEGGFLEPSLTMYCTNASISVLEVPKEKQKSQGRLKHYSIEHVDLGAQYYQEYFHGKEHCNYFGVDDKLGPVAVSLKREKLEDSKEFGLQYHYRIIFRTSELVTLRGMIQEDAVPSVAKHGTVRGLPLKDVLEAVILELNTQCLRLAMNSSKVTEQLLKLDEQGLCRKHKVGILYCKAGQSSEEEMYNNEYAGPAFEEFMSLLGEKVCLRGFSKYSAQLDTKTDSTGTHSLYTSYQDYEIMFHVSTLLPYTPNNRQQLLRKRHIGNDIVTVIFQEPGALPFTPQNIRSHFQHVFIIVRVFEPCTENVCYSVAVTRSKDVPPFGPPVPSGVPFRKSDVFRDFLLAKVINAENAAHKSDKFHTMATRTRQEYIKDLAENYITNTPIDTSGKFNLISLTSKKKERTRPRIGSEMQSAGALSWRVVAQDFSRGAETECALGISNEFMVLIETATKEVVFNCYCADVIGWTPEPLSLKIFYGRGDHILIRTLDGNGEDIKEIVQRLKIMTTGCETVDMTLRRNGLGQLGFHVKYDGTVAEVEEYGFAWQAGLRQGSRLVEICKVAVVTLTHDQMIDLLRTSVTVKVVIIPPHEDGVPRRGLFEAYELSSVEHKEMENSTSGTRPPFRSNTAWQWSGSATHHGASPSQKWVTPGHALSLNRLPKQATSVSSRDPQSLHGSRRPVSFPETPYIATSPTAVDKGQPHRQTSGSFSTPNSGGATYSRYKATPDSRTGTPQRSMLQLEPYYIQEGISSPDKYPAAIGTQEITSERHKSEPMWHIPAQNRAGTGLNKRPSRQEIPGKNSPHRHSRGEPQYSSHSSSNTLSSTASSNQSDERWFDTPEQPDLDLEPLSKGTSNDSGIDTTIPNFPHTKPARLTPRREKPQKPVACSTYPGMHDSSSREKRKESMSSNKGYRPKLYSPGNTGGNVFNQTRTSFFKSPETPNPPHMTQSSSFQLSSSVPKSFFSRQNVRNQIPAGWKKPEEAPSTQATFTDPKKQVDVNTKNVFGQPRLRASLRDLRSPRKNYKSTIEDDLKRLIIMDNFGSDQEQECMSPQKTLQRTLSDESLCSGRRDPGFACSPGLDCSLGGDALFTSSYPSNTMPVRRQHTPSLSEKSANISSSELSLNEMRDSNTPHMDPGMMPLPDTASGLEWSSLVSAAKAYEVQRAASLFSLNEVAELRPAQSGGTTHLSLERQHTPRSTPTSSGELTPDLTGKVLQLEVLLKQLHTDLQKEKLDKEALAAEVACLRQNNQRLQEESTNASEQLRKFAEIISNTVEKKD